MGVMCFGCTTTHDTQIQGTALQTEELVPTDESPILTSTIQFQVTPTTPLVTTPAQQSSPASDLVLTPAFENLALPDDFIFESLVSDCKLPCWQGLSVGLSTRDDIRETIKQILETENYDVFQQNTQSELTTHTVIPIKLLWRIDDIGTAFEIDLELNEISNTLTYLQVRWGHVDYRQFINIKRIISELGTPSDVRVGIFYTQAAEVGIITFLEYRELGVSFLLGDDAPVNTGTHTFPICFQEFGDAGKMQIGSSVEETRPLADADEIIDVNAEEMALQMEKSGEYCVIGEMQESLP
jgi:hypothetical protein